MTEDFYKEHLILIVDDNATNLAVITDYLAEQGFKMMIARNGEICLKRAQIAKPSLILLDVMMPGIDGFETCRRLKADESTKDIPVIFMTALNDVEDKVKGFQMGGVDYITKPIQHEEVFARVKTHLRIQVQANQLSEQNLRLQEMTTVLEKLNADKDKFFSIVAHDLKGPFMPLLGNLELLAEMIELYSLAETKTMLQSVYRSAKNVFSLLENLLQWARLQQGRMEYQPSKLDLQKIAGQTVQLLSANAVNKKIVLSNAVPSGVFVQADENMLDMVIRNLTNNALKFTPVGGQVTIESGVWGAGIEKPPNPQPQTPDPTFFVELTVSDTGVGISEQDAAKLFKLEVHHSTIGTAKEQGTGLGLLICKEMVEKSGGQIWVESQLGKGTKVKFTIPLDKATAADSLVALTTKGHSALSSSVPLEEFVVPPLSAMAMLFELSKEGDLRAIEEQAMHLRQLDERYAPFADRIAQLAKGFEEDEITILLERCITNTTANGEINE